MGIILRGKVKNQKRNWLIRPIDTHAIQYALDDVRYLLPLKDKIMTRLMEKGLMDRYILKNLQVQNKVLSENANDKYVKIAGYSNLQPHEQEIFRKVFDVRDDYAQMYNVPPFQVIGNRDLLGIARDLNHINRLHFSAALGVNAIKELMSDLKATVGTSKSTN
jgi:ribonuclease D